MLSFSEDVEHYRYLKIMLLLQIIPSHQTGPLKVYKEIRGILVCSPYSKKSFQYKW